MRDVGVDVLGFCNVRQGSSSTADDESLLLGCLSGSDPDVPVIAMGRVAEKELTRSGRDFLAIPHLSGLNRQLNDPDVVRFYKERIRGWLSSQTTRDSGEHSDSWPREAR